ncbi:putative membrane protein [Paraburkholderia sp. HC6.4b]|uniref:hypothetical protein n=1 Tax=unclassified Paraburkholderia TaxID=2615204 RepID=UPI001611E40C|nr:MULTISPECIES: hypothetical protein [unclassified Paraburkholderia]MBB5411930.1 putative membrane protein [Paraburkholderia sp. HC6.4b]MBB5450242.1 putative membrane protein [Paraburkholderia sp. Kb1A]
MGQHTTAQVKSKDASLTVSQHETDAPILPMAQIEKLIEILPNRVDWVFAEATQEGDFRRSETRRVNTLVFVERLTSMLSGLIIGALALVTSGYLAVQGHDAVAGIIGGTTVVGLVSAFVIGQKKQAMQQNSRSLPKK